MVARGEGTEGEEEWGSGQLADDREGGVGVRE